MRLIYKPLSHSYCSTITPSQTGLCGFKFAAQLLNVGFPIREIGWLLFFDHFDQVLILHQLLRPDRQDQHIV